MGPPQSSSNERRLLSALEACSKEHAEREGAILHWMDEEREKRRDFHEIQ